MTFMKIYESINKLALSISISVTQHSMEYLNYLWKYIKGTYYEKADNIDCSFNGHFILNNTNIIKYLDFSNIQYVDIDNILKIKSDINNYKYLSILELIDDYYLVRILYSDFTIYLYICDQYDGLIMLINDILYENITKNK